MNYTLKYRSFDSLLADVMIDFRKYQQADLINELELIKVARKCNYDLGLRIYRTREVVLEVERGRVRLPEDFYVANYGLVLGRYERKEYLPQGSHTEEVILTDLVKIHQDAPPEHIDTCSEPVIPEEPEEESCEECPGSCHLDCKGNQYQLVQKLQYTTRKWTELAPLQLVDETQDFNGEFCPGKYWEYAYSGTIKDGWLYLSFEVGKVYLNYEADMVDEDGSLLVPDHELLNDYYEYALKQRIIENLIMNDEEINANKIQIIEQRYRAARNNAVSFVNTPNFKELRETYRMNRNAMLSKYYDNFASRPRIKGR